MVTLFPALFEAYSEVGMVRKAMQQQQLALNTVNPRDYATDTHRTVDDRPFGGGPGMVMKVEPLQAAIKACKQTTPNGPVIYLSPQGQRFDQAMAESLAEQASMVLVCGRYEGIDERLIEMDIDREVSVGDYVLSGGETAAMCVIDAVSRLLPGVLGDAESVQQDSFTADGLLDHPHYTRPESVAGRDVPEVLLSGDHQRIRQWRRQQALTRTQERRPDLLADANIDEQDRAFLKKIRLEKIRLEKARLEKARLDK